MTPSLDSALAFIQSCETPWSRDTSPPWGIHDVDPPPYNRLYGPVHGRGPVSGVLYHQHQLLAQWGEPHKADLTFSVAKSILSSTVGMAVDRGLIKSEKDLVYPYVGPIIPYEPYKALMNKADHLDQEDVFDLFSGPHNRKITWEHLLSQTSDWEGSLWGKPDWADRPQGNSSEWLNRPRNEPGTVYKYNDTRVNVLALAILNVWRKPLPVVLKENLMDKIGASPTWRWTGYENSFVILDGQIMQSVSGGGHWGGGMIISGYDMARFGYLTLRRGKWKDRQLLSEEWIRLATTPTPAPYVCS